MNFDWSRALCGALAAAALALLASCGGGGSVGGSYTPQRIVAFGDESSVITTQGLKYTINAADPTPSLCTTNPTWIVYLASAYGLTFEHCSDGGSETSITRATPGAKVADVANQIDNHLGADGLSAQDLVTVLAGANDVLEQYALYPAQSEDELDAELDLRGAALAAQVNRLADVGAKVLIVTLPDQGLTPFAIAEQAAHAIEDDRAALLTRLTDRFNGALMGGLLNDGSKIGLVYGDNVSRQLVQFPGTYGLVDVIDPACNLRLVSLPNCTMATLVDQASPDSWLWADNFQFSPAGQRQLGSAAASRAQSNPF